MGLKDFFSRAKSASSSQPARQRVERAPRVRINALHSMEFFPREPAFSSPLLIENVSASGLGLILPADVDVTTLDVMIGNLQINGVLFPLVLKVVRFNGDHVGTRIETPKPDFIAALHSYFESEIAAIRLKPTRADFLKQVAHGTPHWYQGANNCDLSYVSSGSQVVEFACTVFGNHIEAQEGKPLKVSTVVAQKPGDRRKGADFLQTLATPDSTLIELAKRVVLAVEELPEDHRDAILKYLL